MARCSLRSMTTNSGPVEAALGSQTYWPGPSRAAFSAIDVLRWCLTGCAAAEAAAHTSNANPISSFTDYLVQAISPEQAPGYRLGFILAGTIAAYGNILGGW